MNPNPDSSLFHNHGRANPASSNNTDQGPARTPTKPWQTAGPPRPFLLRDATIIDVKDGSTYTHCSVQLVNGLIQNLGRHASRQQALAAGTGVHATDLIKSSSTLDLDGAFLLPGFIDCSVYLATPPGEVDLASTLRQDATTSLLRQPWLARQMLGRGFTTVLDCGGAGAAIKRTLADGMYPGPRVLTCGRSFYPTGSRGAGDARFQVANGVDGCTRAVREVVSWGVDFVSISMGTSRSLTQGLREWQSQPGYTAAEVRAFVESAEAEGKYVSASAASDAQALLAVENGVREIRDCVAMTENTARLMAAKGVWFTPALASLQAPFEDEPLFTSEEKEDEYRCSFMLARDSAEKAIKAGVPMCFGTGLLGPLQGWQSREFGIRGKGRLGMRQDPLKILQSATVNAAHLLGLNSRLGRIKEGLLADICTGKDNPLKDDGVLSRPNETLLAVFKGGRVVESRWSRLPKEGEGQGLIA